MRPSDTEGTSPGDAASTAVGGAAAVGGTAARRGQIVDAVPALPTLDGPVTLMVEQLVDVLQLFDALNPVAEQVIDVPKIFVERIPPRTSVREPQLAEQLVELPKIIFFSIIALLNALLEQRTVEQNVDIPVVVELVEVFPVFSQDRILL